MSDLQSTLRYAMNENSKKITLKPKNKEGKEDGIYTAKTPEEVAEILRHFGGEETTRRLIGKNTQFDESRTYEVREDKDGNEYILLYEKHQTRPIKCIKYKEGITGFAYRKGENGGYEVGFFEKGTAKVIKFCHIDIEENSKSCVNKTPEYDEKPTKYIEDDEQNRETFIDPDSQQNIIKY